MYIKVCNRAEYLLKVRHGDDHVTIGDIRTAVYDACNQLGSHAPYDAAVRDLCRIYAAKHKITEIQTRIDQLMRTADSGEQFAEIAYLEAVLNGGPWYGVNGDT